MKNIKNITVIGLGLIGGSLALAFKELSGDISVTGYDVISDTLSIAKYRNIIDKIAEGYDDAVIDADLVVIATPISRIIDVVQHIKEHLKKGAIVTDVGSAKEKIVNEVNNIIPQDIIFIGGHPMAGSENEGVLSARPDLFKNAFYILTPTEKTKTEPLVSLHALLAAIGSKVISISPREHDEVVSLISHLPHILSTNLVDLVGNEQIELRNLFKLCAGGFRDMTRIAASNPKMWLDITLENKNEIIKSIDKYMSVLLKFRQNLEKEDREYIKEHYNRAKEARLNIPKYVEKDISNLYELMIAIPDRRGVLSEITLAISSSSINIEDISIFHSTEFVGGGILKILVQGENAGEIAKKAVEEKGFEARIRKVLGE